MIYCVAEWRFIAKRTLLASPERQKLVEG